MASGSAGTATKIPVIKSYNEKDVASVFKFWVEIKSIVVAEFTQCSGLSVEREIERIEEGGVNDKVHIRAGRMKYANIVLKRGTVYGRELWDWYMTGQYDGKVRRINFSSRLHDSEGKGMKRWNVNRALPIKWEGPQLDASSTQVAVETLELAHEGLTLN